MGTKQEVMFELTEQSSESDETLKGRIVIENGALTVFLDGFGNCSQKPGHGYVAALQLYDEQAELLVWPHFEDDDPGFTINLETARDKRRVKKPRSGEEPQGGEEPPGELHCQRCGNPLVNGFCQSEVCPFSDHKQDCPVGLTGHPMGPKEGEDARCTCHGDGGQGEDPGQADAPNPQ